MTALEVKDDILFLLAREKKPANLERIRAFIASIAFDEEDEADWWSELPVEQQERILRIKEQMHRGENVVSHEEAIKRLNLGQYANRMVR